MQLSQSREQSNRFARQLFDGLPPRYDLLAEALSLGQNGRWRRAMVDVVVAARPRLVADVAIGPAGVALQIEARSGASVAGIDLTEAMLRRGMVNARRRGRAGRIHLTAGRGEQLPFADATFDALTFTYLLRYVAAPEATIRELVRGVKPEGVVENLEFHVPPKRVRHGLWAFNTRAVLPVAGCLTGGREWFEGGTVPGPVDLGSLPQVPGRVASTGLVGRWGRRRSRSAQEPGRKARHVGS